MDPRFTILRILLLLTATLTSSDMFAAEPEFTDVFVAGKGHYKSIRIPSVVVSKKGVVLAFAEGRSAPADQAANQIILKRSLDGSKTWGPLQLIAEDGANSLNNPTAVVEQESGRVFLMYQRIPAHLQEASKNIETGYDGTNIYRNFLVWSDDEGATWSAPLDVTHTTIRPTRATTLASAPGIGIQFTRGPHRGRLIIPFNEGPYWQWNNYAVYSDDRGRTWSYGENVPGAFRARCQTGPAQPDQRGSNGGTQRWLGAIELALVRGSEIAQDIGEQ